MYIEHQSDRLRVLVARTAAGLIRLDEPERERALAVLREVVRRHASEQHDPGFADEFAAVFVAAVQQRMAEGGAAGGVDQPPFIVGQADADPAVGDWA